MYSTFPKIVNPWTVIQKNETIHGALDLSDFERVIRSQNRQIGKVEAEIKINSLERNKLALLGHLKYHLAFSCQRCLETIEQDYDFNFQLIIVKFESLLSTLTEDEDGVVCDESLDLIQLLEDEILLRLPMIAKHDDCAGLKQEDKTEDSEGVQKPFASLKDLMN